MRGYRYDYGPNLTALRDEGRPGRCLGCDGALRYYGAGRRPVLCGDRLCLRLYHRAYRADRSLREGRRCRGGA